MKVLKVAKRLLVLDVDNTLLHVPIYDPLLYILAGQDVSEEEFYRGLPKAGISISSDSLLKVYPRPHLIEFLNKAENLGYDLALCTTGTQEYIERVLPLCGVSKERFVAILSREHLRSRGLRQVKDIRQFVSLGYEREKIVAIDDRNDVYIQNEYVLRIPSFDVRDDSFKEDNELLVMIDRLAHLGDGSLAEARRLQRIDRERESLLLNLAYAAFDSNKYRKLPFRPEIYGRPFFDLEDFPESEHLKELSLDSFLVYKCLGLVGAVERKSDCFLINNFCPEIWTDVSEGVSRINHHDDGIHRVVGFLNNSGLKAKCQTMGYNVSKDDLLTLAAVTLQTTYFEEFHVLALNTELIVHNPMSYK